MMALDLAWYDWAGLAGTLMILAAFALLQAGKLAGTSLGYQLLNLFGARLLLERLGCGGRTPGAAPWSSSFFPPRS